MPNVLGYAVNLCPNAKRERKPCAELWNKMVVRWNGKVVACCHDWKNTMELGDANVSDLKSIWAGQLLANLRHEHLAGSYRGLCSTCIEWSTPDEFESDYKLAKNEVILPNG
jgi:radical SAM protein with 4Fe4S-binding SPASM domain